MSVEVIRTIRIGQLTGSTDPMGWPLLNDTSQWGVVGVDLGTNTEHDGKLYFFFGDVATKQESDDIENSDLVAWTDETSVVMHGGHLAMGWKFTLPFEPTIVQGQSDWRFCVKCHGLFWTGDGMGVCAKGGGHFAMGWKFTLPFEPTIVQGQSDWRFCVKCHGLFWAGDYYKGICPGASGGGFHLHAVLKKTGKYDPLQADDPIGFTRTLEVPSGAFSFEGRVYVFVNISEEKHSRYPRPGDPTYGCYLVSKAKPDISEDISKEKYHKEFLFSPRIGWCGMDQKRTSFESHDVLGFKFVLPHNIPVGPGHEEKWSHCKKCEAMFWNGDPNFKGVCQKGGPHEADDYNFVLPHGIKEDSQNQEKWQRCKKCMALFFNGYPYKGFCPGGGIHEAEATGVNLVLPHVSIQEDPKNQADWRFCGKCFGMFFDGDGYHDKGVCPKGGFHEAWGFNFVLPHDIGEGSKSQADWRFCGKCFGMFFDGYLDKGVCPKDGSHVAMGYNFALPHHTNADHEHQADWSFCDKCAGLFFNGYHLDDKGICPKDGSSHHAKGLNFVLPHNPGEDPQNQGDWRFCVRCSEMVLTGQPDIFGGVAPCVVQNTEHPGLPPSQGLGLVMFGFGYVGRDPNLGNPGFRLAWMPLESGGRPIFDKTQYYDNAKRKWSEDPADACNFLSHSPYYTSVSAAWLEEPKLWILLYSNANDTENFSGPAVVRIGATLWDLTNANEIEIFDPHREQAYGNYMHSPGRDCINPEVPPSQPPGKDNPGWAYGVFILKRFTEWDPATRILGIYYLLSLSSPYQVQVMYTRLRLD